MTDTESDWDKIQRIFDAALERSGDERVSYLRDVCAGDDDLRGEVEQLLKADSSRSDLFEVENVGRILEEIPHVPDDELARKLVGKKVGGYSVDRLIATGGMGSVYAATQDYLERKIALKVLHADLLSAKYRSRFEEEWQILGFLRHPSIAQIFEAGFFKDEGSDTEVPFFAMELVSGASLDEWIRDKKPDLSRRLEVFAKICDAVEYAHRKGVLHLDLKPRNVVLEGDGSPKVLDFGIAQSPFAGRADQQSRDDTVENELAGTLAYMSPEQTFGEEVALDARSDVYSLGVILYEILADRLPYSLGVESFDKAFQIIRSTSPTPPSRLPGSSASTSADNLVLKAIEKHKEDRYASAADLASDVRRFLAGEQIPSPGTTQASRRPLTTILAVLFAIGCVALIGKVWRQDRAIADLQGRKSDAQIHVAKTAAASQRDSVGDYVARVKSASGALERLRSTESLHQLRKCREKDRSWEWSYLMAKTDAAERVIVPSNGRRSWTTSWSQDGRWLAWSDAQGGIGLQDMLNDRSVSYHKRAHSLEIRSLAFAGSKRLVSASHDKLIRVWGVSPKGIELSKTLSGHESFIHSLDAHAESGLVASASQDHSVKIWNLGDASLVRTLRHPWWVWSVSFSPDGRRVVTSCRDNYWRVWELSSGKLLGEASIARDDDSPEYRNAWPVVFLNEKQIATGSHDGEIALWDWDQQRVVRNFFGHRARVWDLARFGDYRIASASGDRSVRVWDIESGREEHRLLGHAERVFGVAAEPTGRRLASCGSDGSVRSWYPDASSRSVLAGSKGGFISLAVDEKERFVATGCDYAEIRLRDAESLELLHILKGHRHTVVDLDFRPGGAELASASEDGTVIRWSTESGERVRPAFKHGPQAWSVSYHPSASVLATGASDGSIKLLGLETEAAKTFKGHDRGVRSLRFDPTGKWLASGSGAGNVRLWRAEDGATVREFDIGDRSLDWWSLEFSPDGNRLIGTARLGGVFVWEVSTGVLLNSWVAHTEITPALACTPDGKRLVTGGGDHAIKIWDLASGENLLTLEGHFGWVFGLAFSADGERLYSCSNDKTLRDWDARSSAIRILEQGDHVERRRQMQHLVERLFDEEFLLRKVRERIDRNSQLDEQSRRTAQRLALDRGDRPQALLRTSWKVLAFPEGGAAAYERALRQSLAACELAPKSRSYLTVQGAAWYRNGDYSRAKEVLERIDRKGSDRTPEAIAFLTLTYAKLQDVDHAKRTYEELLPFALRREYSQKKSFRSLTEECRREIAALEADDG